jgi:hypothetical protein
MRSLGKGAIKGLNDLTQSALRGDEARRVPPDDVQWGER